MDDEERDDLSRQPIWLPPATLAPITETDQHVLHWQVRGEAKILAGGVPFELRTGSALWIPVGTEHSFTTPEDSVVIPMLFPVADTATTLSEPTVVRVDPDLRTLFLAFVQSTFDLIERNANIARQILAIIEEDPAAEMTLPMPRTEAAQLVAEALLFNPGDDRSVEALARSVHASVSKIERAFLAETQMTLRQWRIRNRMEAAAVLLRSRAKVDAVAQRVGYTNTSAFHRVFKTHFALTPGEYIAQHRAAPPARALPESAGQRSRASGSPTQRSSLIRKM